MSFDKALFLIAQIMKKVIKDNLYIESYKILHALESANLYNELIYNIFIIWEDIKTVYNIQVINIPHIDFSNTILSSIITLLDVMEYQKYHPVFKIPFIINKKHKSIHEWNKYIMFILKYFGLDYTLLGRIRISINARLSLYEYKEIAKLFLREKIHITNVSMD